MYILSIRTDKPLAEIGLYEDGQELHDIKWEAHRHLAETLNAKIREILKTNNLSLQDLGGLVVYKGPGSFTGLRIGLSVANAMADSLSISIVATTGESWLADGLKNLATGSNEKIALPEYGAPPHITVPRK